MRPTFENLPEMVAELLDRFDALEKRISQASKPVPKDRMGTKEAAEFLCISPSTLYKLSMKKEVPYKKFGGSLIFSRKELQTWQDAMTYDREEEILKVFKRGAKA